MAFLDTLDDLGINVLIRPMSLIARLHLLNTFDDIGINLVCRPLRYLHRFAAFLLDSDLYPAISYSDLASLKADASIVSSMSKCSTSLSGGRSGGRVSERGSIRKTRSGRGSRRSGDRTRSELSSTLRSTGRPGSKELMRANGQP